MKLAPPFSRRRIALLVATAWLLTTWASAPLARQDAPGDELRKVERWGDLVNIFSGDLHLPADVVQRGSVVCIGGSATIDGDVTRDVVAILCDVELRGSVGGSVTGVLADMELQGASVSGELVNVLGTLVLEDSSVDRELVSILGALDRDELSRTAGQVVHIGLGGKWLPNVGALIFWIRLFHKFVAFVLIVLLVLLVPERIEAMSEETPLRYVPAFFMGVLGYLGLLVGLGLLAVTVVGVFPALLAFWILKWMGIAAIFHAIGRRVGRSAGFSPSTLGAVLLVFAVYVVLSLAPSPLGIAGLVAIAGMKVLFFLLVEVPAVGLVILTRVGGRRSGGPGTALPAHPAATRPGPPGASPAEPTPRGATPAT